MNFLGKTNEIWTIDEEDMNMEMHTMSIDSAGVKITFDVYVHKF